MATKEQYEAALVKAETLGVTSLSREQLELIGKLAKQAGSTGNRARRVLDGK
nr:hypothetical protein [Kibdelosporangium sp. MJ126-NF4]CEL13486.1 hypothetical protein [Kibdelosporangium sp. MJ126-NF4]CTQ99172.1 hypothetical protein [Kibdelosporangium sp. MJ126-NF4]